MCAPKRYGGEELSFRLQVEALAEIGRGCPSASWVATILSAMAWIAGAMPDETQEELLGDGDPRISGALSPTGTLEPVDGGYRLSGRWGYNTGGHGSRWTMLHALLGGVPTAVFVESASLERLDDWFPSGMAGTGSNSVAADDVLVPERRTAALFDMINGNYPTDRHNADNPYFRLPLAAVLAINAGGTPVGIARGAMDAYLERLPGRAITYTTYDDQSQAAITHLHVGEAALMTDSAQAHVHLATDILDQAPDGVPTFFDRARGRSHIGYATGLARQAVDLLFHASGASAVQDTVAIQRFQRDMQTLANHAIMHGPTGIEMYGRVLCGLEPNSPLV
jgi:alkylation response protein AidB-like acyl-CoA dehydrogenase